MNIKTKEKVASQEGKSESITFCEMHKKDGGCGECPNRYACKNSTLKDAELQLEYGRLLGDKIRAETTDFNNLSDFEKFVLDRGFYYDTEETLKAAYDRVWKSRHGILITEDEFVTETGKGGSNTFSQWNEEATRKSYRTLAALAVAGKITNSEVFSYAVYSWCIRKPEAIVAYQRERDKWEVNNCDTEITKETARIEVCEEWGFEASRVRIVGTPYYDATDWQFIRFDIANMTWLWKNGNLYQVYE